LSLKLKGGATGIAVIIEKDVQIRDIKMPFNRATLAAT
jgi:hypothetical protein